MLISPIQINGVQSISASLGWLRFGELGGMMVHSKLLTVLCGVLAREPAVGDNRGGQGLTHEPKANTWDSGCTGQEIAATNALSLSR